MDFQKHLDPDELLHLIAEYYALQLPEEIEGVITVEWDEEDGGVNIYLKPDEGVSVENINLKTKLNIN